MWNGTSFQRHVAGANHKRMMEAIGDSHRQMAALMQKHSKIMDIRVMIGAKVNKGKTPDKKATCHLCAIDVFATIMDHRRTEAHNQLVNFLYPRCRACQKNFTERSEYDSHRLSEPHLRNMTKRGVTELEKDYVNTFNFKQMTKDEIMDEIAASTKKQAEETKNLSDANVLNYTLADYDGAKCTGTSFVRPVNGSFCRLCKMFLNCDVVDTHMKSKDHYNKFKETVEKKKMEAAAKK